MPIYKKVNKNFFKKWSPEMAYVLGFFMADGYVTHNRRGASFFCFNICDLDILKKIKIVLGSEHKISKRVRKNSKHSIQYRLQIGSKEMCADLECLGAIAGKTNNLSIPRMPAGLFSHFTRGYFDGDGNVWMGIVHKERRKPTWTIMTMFTSCSRDFLVSLQLGLLGFGIGGGSIYTSKHNYSRLQLSTRDSLKLWDFMYNQSVKSHIQLYLERKQKIFKRYISLRKNAGVV